VQEVQGVSHEVAYGTPLAYIGFPSTVLVTLDDASSMFIGVAWDAQSAPPYDKDTSGDYVFEGTLVSLPAGVTNPDDVKAMATVTVLPEEVDPDPDPDPELVWMDVSSQTQLQDAKNKLADGLINAIRLTGDITIDRQHRFERDWEFYAFDMNGYTIFLAGGPISFEADNTQVYGGRFSAVDGVTCWMWDDVIFAENDWAARPWNSWHDPNEDPSQVVMVSGDDVTFAGIIFEVDFADWFQYQNDKTATGLTIINSSLYGVSLFHSIDVEIRYTDVYNRIGLERHQRTTGTAPVLEHVNFRENKGPYGCIGSVGIGYINCDATLIYISWLDDFTGMYVGKSLKYYGDYSDAEPTLDDAVIDTTKYGLVWWALNHYKAKLTVNGVVDIHSYPNNQGPGLMLVGTDYRDYPALAGTLKSELVASKASLQGYFSDPANRITDRICGDYVGGSIVGKATFRGPQVDKYDADIWFGKPTQEFLSLNDKHYEGDVYYKYDLCEKSPVSLKGVDYQVSWKDADRLYIGGGLNFETTVNIFTPSNKYIGCIQMTCDCESEYGEKYVGDDVLIETRAPFCDSVWLGDVSFDFVNMFGDFMIEDSKTVIFEEMFLRCDNLRAIYTRADLRDCKHPTSSSFDHRGTLIGGVIKSDTCKGGVLVLGDGLLVKYVTISDLVRNVILETVRLEDVDIYVGEAPINRDARYVCGTLLEYDVHIWKGHNATFSNVFWSGNTWVEVRDAAKITLEDRIRNEGWLKIQKLGTFMIAADANLDSDVRDHNSAIDIYVLGGRGYIKVNYDVAKAYEGDGKYSATWGRWKFNEWKSNAWIHGDFISAKYKFEITAINGDDERTYTRVYDLRDPESYDDLGYRLLEGQGVRLTDLIGKDYGYFPLGTNFKIRITVDEDYMKPVDGNQKVIDPITIKACWLNSCSTTHLCVIKSATIILDGKPVQVHPFDVGFVPGGKDLEVLAGSKGNKVTYEVENTGTISGTDTVKLYLNNVLVDESAPITMAAGGRTTGYLYYTAPGELGQISLRLETSSDYAVQKVTVVDTLLCYFAASIDAPAKVMEGDYFDVVWTVQNTGGETCTQDVERSTLMVDHLSPIQTDTVTLNPGETWSAPEGFFASVVGDWVFTLVTADDTAIAVVTVLPEDVDPRVVQSTVPVTQTVAFGTPLADIGFPATVLATVNGDTEDLDVDWDMDSAPAYDPNAAGDYVFEGTLVNLPPDVVNPDNVKAQATVTVLEEDVAPPALAGVTAEVQEFQNYWYYDVRGENVSGEAITVQVTIDGTTVSRAVGAGESFHIEIALTTEHDDAVVTALDAADNVLQTVTVPIVK